MKERNIYGGRVSSVLLGAVVCLFWGSLYPTIKMGYGLFGIDTSNVASIILFVGMRFLICGAILTAAHSLRNKKIEFPRGKVLIPVLGVAFTTIVIHYTLSYTAISMCEASKSAILKQIGYLFISCFAFLFRKEDKFSIRKVIGGVLGFCGIIVVNLNGLDLNIGVGEILIILASLFSVAGNIISKSAYDRLEPFYLVAYSQLVGGVILTLAGIALGGELTRVTPAAVGLQAYMCFASIASYLLWNKLIKYNDISKMSVIKYLEPIFGVLLSGLIVKENILRLEYLLALIVIVAAIVIANIGTGKQKEK